jgi:predicted acylesterase/phospholipase RssA
MNPMPGNPNPSHSPGADSSESVGLVLAGGGSYGAYEVGVMKALFEGTASVCAGVPIEAQLFAGASVGAINAAMMVAHAECGLAKAAATLEEIWRREMADAPGKCGNGVYRLRGVPPLTNPACVRNPLGLLSDALDDGAYFLQEWLNGGRRFFNSSGSAAHRILKTLNFATLLDLRPLANLVKDIIPLEALARSKKALKVVATNFDSGEIRIFENAEIATVVGHAAILASAAIPIFFPPVQIGDELYVDGGTLQNSPILPAIGTTHTLHVIYMDPDVASIPVETLQSTLAILDRLLVMEWAFTLSQNIEVVDDYNRSYDFLNARHGLPPSGDPRLDQLLKAADRVVAASGGPKWWDLTTIHRYHPTDDLGDLTGLLDFRADRIDALIERGYRDALRHDCARDGCVLSSQSEAARTRL